MFINFLYNITFLTIYNVLKVFAKHFTLPGNVMELQHVKSSKIKQVSVTYIALMKKLLSPKFVLIFRKKNLRTFSKKNFTFIIIVE